MERLRQSLHCSLMVTVFLIAAAGFIVFNIGVQPLFHHADNCACSLQASSFKIVSLGSLLVPRGAPPGAPHS